MSRNTAEPNMSSRVDLWLMRVGFSSFSERCSPHLPNACLKGKIEPVRPCGYNTHLSHFTISEQNSNSYTKKMSFDWRHFKSFHPPNPSIPTIPSPSDSSAIPWPFHWLHAIVLRGLPPYPWLPSIPPAWLPQWLQPQPPQPQLVPTSAA